MNSDEPLIEFDEEAEPDLMDDEDDQPGGGEDPDNADPNDDNVVVSGDANAAAAAKEDDASSKKDEVICMAYKNELLCGQIHLRMHNNGLYVVPDPFSKWRPSSWLLHRDSTEHRGPHWFAATMESVETPQGHEGEMNH